MRFWVGCELPRWCVYYFILNVSARARQILGGNVKIPGKSSRRFEKVYVAADAFVRPVFANGHECWAMKCANWALQ